MLQFSGIIIEHIKIIYNMNKMNKLAYLMAVLWFSTAFNGPDSAKTYIAKYSPLAMAEMERSGIPASIKLAQALIESECGRSPLAAKANNHFGIKCGTTWAGGTYFKHDDDIDSTGTIIESCFRAYPSVEESFKAHTDFLKDPKKVNRYGFLFTLPSHDYSAWARGLKDAGYASDPTYPEKLIRVIEKYNLTQYDKVAIQSDVVNVLNTKTNTSANTPSAPSKDNKSDSRVSVKESNATTVIIKYRIVKTNDVRHIVTSQNTTPEACAKSLGMKVTDLMAYNECITSPTMPLLKSTKIYVEKKKKDYEGKDKEHTVIEGETIEDIANIYGIRAATLYSLNKLPRSAAPLTGEKIALKEKVKHKPKHKRKSADKDQFLF
jgi:hypothetical protein